MKLSLDPQNKAPTAINNSQIKTFPSRQHDDIKNRNLIRLDDAAMHKSKENESRFPSPWVSTRSDNWIHLENGICSLASSKEFTCKDLGLKINSYEDSKK